MLLCSAARSKRDGASGLMLEQMALKASTASELPCTLARSLSSESAEIVENLVSTTRQRIPKLSADAGSTPLLRSPAHTPSEPLVDAEAASVSALIWEEASGIASSVVALRCATG